MVSVHESTDHYEIFHQERLVARHQKAARHSVVMEPGHYAGLLRVGPRDRSSSSPHFDPAFAQLGEVMVRELKLYQAISQSEGGGAQ
jgi:hypothetical protein